jgi:hypothetical protein
LSLLVKIIKAANCSSRISIVLFGVCNSQQAIIQNAAMNQNAAYKCRSPDLYFTSMTPWIMLQSISYCYTLLVVAAVWSVSYDMQQSIETSEKRCNKNVFYKTFLPVLCHIITYVNE